jgi:ABC-type sugar transport system substrate-binding protein
VLSVTLVVVIAAGGVAAAALAGKIKAYSGFEKSYPHSFHVPKKVRGKHFTIGCQNPVGPGNETTTVFCKGVQAEAAALGMKYIGLNDDLSVSKQVTNFNQLLAQGANAIVLYPLAPNALRASLSKANQQHVAVIGLNVTFTKSATAPGYNAQVWEGRGDDINGGQRAMSGLLGKYSKIDGVLAYNDPSAVGAYTAARSGGRTGIKIIGINGSSLALTALKAGHIAATIQVDAVGQGAQAAGAAYDVLTKQGLPLPHVVVREPRLITKSNIRTTSSWAQQLARIRNGKLSR